MQFLLPRRILHGGDDPLYGLLGYKTMQFVMRVLMFQRSELLPFLVWNGC